LDSTRQKREAEPDAKRSAKEVKLLNSDFEHL
jgi:hypothetical protein